MEIKGIQFKTMAEINKVIKIYNYLKILTTLRGAKVVIN